MPLMRRIPKFGFTNAPFKVEYDIVNVADLEKLALDTVDRDLLREKRFLSSKQRRIKLLGMGEITKAVTVTVDAASKSAIEKIEKAGGTVTLIPHETWKRDTAKKQEGAKA